MQVMLWKNFCVLSPVSHKQGLREDTVLSKTTYDDGKSEDVEMSKSRS